MNDRHRDLHAMLASLGAPSRFRIALCLLEGDRCVGDLAVAIGLSQSCTTRHVQALERTGVVRSRRDGKRVLVRLELARAGLAEVLGIAPGPAGAPELDGSPAKSRGPRREPAAAGREKASAQRARPARKARVPRPTRPSESLSRPSSATQQARHGLHGPAPEDRPPAGPRSSGTHAAPVEEAPVHPRRPRETIEDFLL